MMTDVLTKKEDASNTENSHIFLMQLIGKILYEDLSADAKEIVLNIGIQRPPMPRRKSCNQKS
jgi:hypothetical protein